MLTFYGVGFGPVTPAIPAGVLVSGANTQALPFEVRIGGTVADVLYFGLAPGLTGLYQLNVVVPDIADNDAAALTCTVGGLVVPAAIAVAVRN